MERHADFLKNLPANVGKYEELLNSIRVFKQRCAKKFDVVSMEKLRVLISETELPLLNRLWETERLAHRYVAHNGTRNLEKQLIAVVNFAPLFAEKSMGGKPKLIDTVEKQLKALPKDKYDFSEFKKHFHEEMEILKKEQKKVSKPQKELLPHPKHVPKGAKNMAIIMVIMIIAVSGGFKMFQPQAGEVDEKVTYWSGYSQGVIEIDGEEFPSGTHFSFIVTHYSDGGYTIYDQRSRKTIDVNEHGVGSDNNHYIISENSMTYINRANGDKVYLTIVELESSKSSDASLSRSNFDHGVSELKNKNYDKAIDFFKRAIELNPKLIEAKLKLAEVYFIIGKEQYDAKDYTSAKQNFENAVKWDSRNSEYLTWYGDSLRWLNKCDLAIEKYKSSVNIFPSGRAYNGMGICYKRLGNMEEACDAWENGKKLNYQKSINNIEKNNC